MIIVYTANGTRSELPLPSSYVENCTPMDLAELAASDFWRSQPQAEPTKLTAIHLLNVDGHDLGVYAVQRAMQPVYSAVLMG